MIRLLYIATLLFFLTSNIAGQISQSDKEILKEVLSDTQTCGNVYFTNKTDSFFINQYQERVREKNIWINKNQKSERAVLTKSDKNKIIEELNTDKAAEWSESDIPGNGKIVQLDSLFKVDSYADSACRSILDSNSKKIRVFSFCKPIFIKKANTFLIYIIETDINPKTRKFFFARSRLVIYSKSGNKWIESGDIYNGIFCNG